jgi:ribosomal protein S18 acetylase RimI-like enzyme
MTANEVLMLFREIVENDFTELIIVRSSTDENNISVQDLTSMGITEATVSEKLKNGCKGWLCEIDKKIAGFAMGNKNTGEMWVIAVLPQYIKRGIGSKLLGLVEQWLFAEGCSELWLTTDINEKLRAYSFYRKHGWVDSEIKDGVRYMKKVKTKIT